MTLYRPLSITPNRFSLLGALAVLLFSTQTSAQTCSCANVPLLGSMQPASPNGGQWYFGTTYEFHDVSDLVAGGSSIPDATGRDRTVQALLLEASRGLTENWSLSVITATVNHDRQVGDFRASTSGLSDAVVMAKYAARSISLYSDTALAFGIGARVPLGEDEARLQDVVLAEDMQPSTGAYGGTLWAYWAKALNDSRRTQIFASATHMQNGDNDRKYQFGDNTVLTFGGMFRTAGPWGFNVELSYRNTARDQRNAVLIPNTGGEWLDLMATVQYRLSESIALGVAAKFPVQRDLHDELQFTSKYALRVSMSYMVGTRR